MAWPDDPIPAGTWPVGYVSTADMQARITDNLNALRSRVSLGLIGDNNNNATVTLVTVSSNYAGLGAVTFTLTSTRKIRVYTQARFQMASGTAARYLVQAVYNTGTVRSIGSAVYLDSVGSLALSATGAAGSGSGNASGSVTLNSGTYIAYAAIQRATGGSNTDFADQFQVTVDDVGGP